MAGWLPTLAIIAIGQASLDTRHSTRVTRPPSLVQRPVVTQKVLELADPGGAWQFTYKYPEIDVPGALMGVICLDFNVEMEKQAQRSLEAFKAAVAENASSASPVQAKSERRVDYAVATRAPGLLALKFTQFEYLRGQAHPSTTVFTRNFSMQGKFLELEDLFTPNSGYREKISAAVGKQLAAQARKRKFPIIAPEGYAPRADNFRNFVVTRSGLKIFFDPAVEAPYYVGVLTATMPWNALERDLNDQGRRIRHGDL